MRVLLHQVLRRLRRDESGQSLIVVVSAMTVLLAIAGFGIDTATWMVRHHHDQVVADSAALAAAHCLANPGQSSSIAINSTTTLVPSCTSGKDVNHATTVAVEYAAANGVTISPSQVSVDITDDQVTVRTANTSASVFARLFGLDKTTQRAGAGAAWTDGTGSCSTPGTGCDFMFAADSNCSSASNGIVFGDSNSSKVNGNTTIQGNIVTNGNLSGQTSGNVSLGNGTFGVNGTCSNSINYNGHDPWSSDPIQNSAQLPFPIDYTKDFPTCGTTGTPQCTGPGGTPSFCTNEGSSIVVNDTIPADAPQFGQVYCAVGPDGTASDPSTWDGSITISLSGTNNYDDTFVGGKISFTANGSDTLSSCGYALGGYSASNCRSSVPAPVTSNYPLFYATGKSSGAATSQSPAITVALGGKEILNGDVFAPNGTVNVSANGNKAFTSFIEAYDIYADIGGTFQGDGPSSSGNNLGGGGAVTLVQ